MAETDPSVKVWETEFTALDLETTGLDPLADRVVEVGAVVFKGDAIIDTFETLVDPGVRISRALTAIHGIDNRMVRGAPSPPEAVARLMVFMGARPLVIHNAPFDMGFIETVLRERFLEAPLNDLFDTCRIAPVVFPGLASYRLGELSRSLGVEQGRGHRALDDSLAAMGVFLSCLREIDPAREMEYGPFERSYSLRSLAALEGSAVPLRWPPGFDAIREACENSGSVFITYQSGSGEVTLRLIKPTGLVRVSGRTMLEAWCTLRGESRTFRFDRIIDVKRLQE